MSAVLNPTIRAKRIEIGFSENDYLAYLPLRGFEGPNVWEKVQKILTRASHDAPDNGCYDKTDFTITFEDDFIYKGTIDLTRKAYNLADHIKSHCRFYAGLADSLPSHLTPDKYKAFLEQVGDDAVKSYLNILNTYIIP